MKLSRIIFAICALVVYVDAEALIKLRGEFNQTTPMVLQYMENPGLQCKDNDIKTTLTDFKRLRDSIEKNQLQVYSYRIIVNLLKKVDTVANYGFNRGYGTVQGLSDVIGYKGWFYYDLATNCRLYIFDSLPSGVYVLFNTSVNDGTMGGIYGGYNEIFSVIAPKTTDTLRITNTDTLIKLDTIIKTITLRDTIKTTKVDTFKNTITQLVHDTIHKVLYDTFTNYITIHDTLIKLDTLHDTTVTYDTILSCIDDDQYYRFTMNNGIYQGHSTNGIQLYESRDSLIWTSNNTTKSQKDFKSTISIKIESNTDANIQAYVYDNSGVFVTVTNFNINKNSNPVKYLTWEGLDKNGKQVSDGIYVIRLITKAMGKISNNLFTVGFKGTK